MRILSRVFFAGILVASFATVASAQLEEQPVPVPVEGAPTDGDIEDIPVSTGLCSAVKSNINPAICELHSNMCFNWQLPVVLTTTSSPGNITTCACECRDSNPTPEPVPPAPIENP